MASRSGLVLQKPWCRCQSISSMKKLNEKFGGLPYIGPLFKKLQRIPPSLSQCYAEAKVVFRAQSTPSSLRSRRETELTRRFCKEGLYIGAAAIIFWIPIVGAPTILFGLLYPKHLLTSQFWSTEERAIIIKQFYTERAHSKESLHKLINQSGLDHSTFAPPLGIYSFDMLPTDHITVLGESVGLLSPMLKSFTPNFILTPYLKTRIRAMAVEIAVDDRLLRRETRFMAPDKLTLTKEELEDAVLRRGGDPSMSEEQLRNFLVAWLEYSGDFGVESDDSEREYEEKARFAASHIAHTCAVPELFFASK